MKNYMYKSLLCLTLLFAITAGCTTKPSTQKETNTNTAPRQTTTTTTSATTTTTTLTTTPVTTLSATSQTPETISIPQYPPGFEFTNIPFEITDYTEMLQMHLPKETVQYSAVWIYEEEGTKTWNKMNNTEKEAFYNKRDTWIDIISDGANFHNGKLKITKSEYETLQETIGTEWKKTYPGKENIVLWWVIYNSSDIGSNEKPKHYIYISHTQMKEE
jgi:hypothetical protein